jgi:hypothetical protein
MGGLGIINLDFQNVGLLSKWLHKLLNEDGVWQELIRRKYMKNKTLSQITHKPGDSQFWSGLLEVKDRFLARGSFKVKSGHQTSFWGDIWLDNRSLKDSYPCLYSIVRKKNASVADVLSTVPLNVSFRRSLRGMALDKWLELVGKLVTVQLTDQRDVFVWEPSANKKFTVKSMYLELMKQVGAPPSKGAFWRTKIPLKIKIFLWYIWKGVILTKDNLAKRKWQGSLKCCFCNSLETIQHLFFDCPLARSVWNVVYITFGVRPPVSFAHLLGSWVRSFPAKIRNQCLVGLAALLWALWLNRNEAVFQNSFANSFVQVIFRGTYWTRCWSLLSKEEEKVTLKEKCRRLEVTSMEIFRNFGWNSKLRLQ